MLLLKRDHLYLNSSPTLEVKLVLSEKGQNKEPVKF